MKGAKLAVMDPRLSNTASMSDFWMPTYPGSEAAVLLAMAKIILEEGNALRIAEQARKEGIIDLRQSARNKVAMGITDLIEINRVTKD